MLSDPGSRERVTACGIERVRSARDQMTRAVGEMSIAGVLRSVPHD
jgi:hypothetical protein